MIQCTPDRSKLFGSHGQRPWLHDVVKEVCSLLARHLSGDWGELDGHDRRQNEDALHDGSRLFSAYRSMAGDKLWVITEAVNDGGYRASTTVMLPEEY
jgi:hypothetical protein